MLHEPRRQAKLLIADCIEYPLPNDEVSQLNRQPLSESASNSVRLWLVERTRKTRHASCFGFDSRADLATDLQHALMGVTLEGKLHLAPIGPNPQHVLDVATGQN